MRLGQTNVDFLDEHENVIGSLDIIVNPQKDTDRVVIHNHPALTGYSTYHCGPVGCENFEEIPAKEQASTPPLPQERGATDQGPN